MNGKGVIVKRAKSPPGGIERRLPGDSQQIAALLNFAQNGLIVSYFFLLYFLSRNKNVFQKLLEVRID